MTAQHLNALGLLLGMVGVLLLFFWGPPLPEMRGAVGIALQSTTVLADGRRAPGIEEVEKRLRHRHEIFSTYKYPCLPWAGLTGRHRNRFL